MKRTRLSFDWFVPALLAALMFSGAGVKAQQYTTNNPPPAFPPDNTTLDMDRDQMMYQVGVRFAFGPPKLTDTNAPAGVYPADTNNPEGNWQDLYGHTVTTSGWGLWNNYDEPVGLLPSGTNGLYLNGVDAWRAWNYTPIDLLAMDNNQPVTGCGLPVDPGKPSEITSATEWWVLRRPEVKRDVEEAIWGVIPSNTPSVIWSVTVTNGVYPTNGGAAYIQKTIVGTIDTSSYPQVRNAPLITAKLWVPASATGRVPVFIIYQPFSFPGFDLSTIFLQQYWTLMGTNETPNYKYGICMWDCTALQPDSGGANLSSYLIGLVNKGNWRKPDDWGALAAWSWGVSRLIDYFETDPSTDPTKVGVDGISRFGKAALVAMAYEPRLAVSFPAVGGSLGPKMNRRHWGQDLENSLGYNAEYHWVCGNAYKWCGELIPGQYLPRKVEICPVDAHSLLSLCAPRPVFINGGDQDSWPDPYGEYLTCVGATPVYELLGEKGLVNPDPLPTKDVAYTGGKIAYRYHTGGHSDAPDMPQFMQWAQVFLDDQVPVVTPSQVFSLGHAACGIIGFAQATDGDNDPLGNWQITGGTGVGIFDIDPATGAITLAGPACLNVNQPLYTLTVTVSDGKVTSPAEQVTVVIPDKIKFCNGNGHAISVSKHALLGQLRAGHTLGSCCP